MSFGVLYKILILIQSMLLLRMRQNCLLIVISITRKFHDKNNEIDELIICKDLQGFASDNSSHLKNSNFCLLLAIYQKRQMACTKLITAGTSKLIETYPEEELI